MAVDRDRIARAVREILEAIGEDPERPGLKATPQRVADAYDEFFAGIHEDPTAPLQQTISVSRGPAPDTLPSGAVMVRDIRFRSVCEHHLLLFRGRAHIAYLPGEKVVGLGALPKVVDILAARPQVQERLGEQIADTIADALDARGVLVVMDASHNCVTMRGERQRDASTVTIAARGELAEPAARAELVALMTAPSTDSGTGSGAEGV